MSEPQPPEGAAGDTEAGLAILRSLGDVHYVDRFTSLA
jgi:hypothetical protein